MPLHWPTFFTRLGSAVVFSAVMMLGLLWNEWSFLTLIALIMLLCLWEYFRLTTAITGRPQRPALKILTLTSGLLAVSAAGFTPWQDGMFSGSVLLLFSIVPVVLLLVGILSKSGALLDGLLAIGALVYIVLPCVMLLGLYAISWTYPLVLVLCIWMNDTMAYLVGSFIGKTPLTQISPKKTWEGTLGGVVLTMVGAGIWGYYSPYYQMHDWIMMAMIVCVTGTAGDLLESKLKRMAGVKDSGAIMPGHGGALDRFDSLLVATPFVFGYAYVFMPPIEVVIF